MDALPGLRAALSGRGLGWAGEKGESGKLGPEGEADPSQAEGEWTLVWQRQRMSVAALGLARRAWRQKRVVIRRGPVLLSRDSPRMGEVRRAAPSHVEERSLEAKYSVRSSGGKKERLPEAAGHGRGPGSGAQGQSGWSPAGCGADGGTVRVGFGLACLAVKDDAGYFHVGGS